jgi:hypothetical protein
MVLNRQFESKQRPVRDYLSVGLMAHDPGRPVRDVFMDCHGRREIAIVEQKSHQNKIAKPLFVAKPSTLCLSTTL